MQTPLDGKLFVLLAAQVPGCFSQGTEVPEGPSNPCSTASAWGLLGIPRRLIIAFCPELFSPQP